MRVQMLGLQIQGARQPQIVIIQERDVLALGMHEPKVTRACDSLISINANVLDA